MLCKVIAAWVAASVPCQCFHQMLEGKVFTAGTLHFGRTQSPIHCHCSFMRKIEWNRLETVKRLWVALMHVKKRGKLSCYTACGDNGIIWNRTVSGLSDAWKTWLKLLLCIYTRRCKWLSVDAWCVFCFSDTVRDYSPLQRNVIY